MSSSQQPAFLSIKESIRVYKQKGQPVIPLCQNTKHTAIDNKDNIPKAPAYNLFILCQSDSLEVYSQGVHHRLLERNP